MESLTIGELAKRGQVHLETIRYYEREGLILPPPRKSSGHRVYGSGAVHRLRFIKRAQGLGFSLAEIRDLLALRLHPDQPCAQAAERLGEKLQEVREKIRQLRAMERTLTRMRNSCDGTRLVSDCPILGSLDRLEPS